MPSFLKLSLRLSPRNPLYKPNTALLLPRKSHLNSAAFTTHHLFKPMASPVSFPSYLLALWLGALLLFASTAVSTPRRALVHRSAAETKTGFRVALEHVDSDKNLTKFQRISRGITRGSHRLHRLNYAVLAAAPTPESGAVQAPVRAGYGEFLMKLAIGTPPISYSAILDTGSDLIWTQCKPCVQCFNQSTPIFDPKKSSSFLKIGCSTDLCEGLPQSECSEDDGCQYLYTYGDYSSTQGALAKETFTFGEKTSIPGIGFGCGGDNEGDGFSQGAGLVGMGRGPLSLVSQLKEKKFAYCLTSMEDRKATSSLFVGSLASKLITMGEGNSSANAVMSTPLILNPLQPSFYYLQLEGITVGSTRLPIDESKFALQDHGTGGMIIDSGTTITYLEKSAFDAVAKEFSSKVDLPVDDSGSTGLELCFKLPAGKKQVEVPKMVFHFKGADVELPAENYVVADSSVGAMCLAMGSSSGLSIFGNVQQQNLIVLHDLQTETLSFLPRQCSKI